MYVRWKVLIGLGVVFWMLLCLTDYFWLREIDFRHSKYNKKLYKNILDVSFYDKEEIVDEILAQTPENLLESTPDAKDDFNTKNILLWNLIVFLSTLSLCFTFKAISNNLPRSVDSSLNDFNALLVQKTSASKIPIPVASKSSSLDVNSSQGNTSGELKEECISCPNLLQNFDTQEEDKDRSDEKTYKKIWSIRNMEKHCAKLREEMINLQASSLKEHASVTKKMDTLGREKRELMRQLSMMQKENRNFKQQLEEMLNERTLLIQRLDCATKEIKSNTRAKKLTMAKLDEAVANAEIFKANLEQIARDKVILEDKLTMLDVEYKRLKEEVVLYKEKMNCSSGKNESNKMVESQDNKEHVIDKYDFSDDNKNTGGVGQTEESDFYISQSEQDIKKVQMKLMTLEKSLESFKFKQPEKNDCLKTTSESANCDVAAETVYLYRDESVITIEEEPSTNSICTEPGCPLEHRECTNPECFLKHSQKSKTEELANLSSGDDSFTKLADLTPVITNLARRTQKYLKTTISDDRLSIISEKAGTTADDSGEDYEPKRRIFSNSPAFQKFLKNALTSGDTRSMKFNVESTS